MKTVFKKKGSIFRRMSESEDKRLGLQLIDTGKLEREGRGG